MGVLELADYRRRVSDLYGAVRATGDAGHDAWTLWRAGRDDLFQSHPESPWPPEHRAVKATIPCFDYDAAWRLTATPEPVEPQTLGAGHSGEGETPLVRFARVTLATPAGDATLQLYWVDTYGGGIFLPFRDATNGSETYGGGRYLLDGAKSADLGTRGDRLVLDFNFAYHPSCAHDPAWSCPLAPPENWLRFPVPVGERIA